MDAKERIEIPYNEAGKKAYDVFYKLAEKLLIKAREATNDYIGELKGAEIIEENSMVEGKYVVVVQHSEGKKHIEYDYRTKEIKIA